MSDLNLIAAKLRKDRIIVTSDWLSQCLEYIREEVKPPENRLILEVQEQWLNTDISTPGLMVNTVFPENINNIEKFQFNGTANLQVNFGIDIGNSSYSQLQKIHKLENENARVSADTSEDTQSGYQPSQGTFVSSWEPKPSRMLKLSVTDGFQTLEAFEHERVGVLDSNIKPGLKIQLSGPVTIKKGKIFLRSNSIRVLGGEVEELAEKFCTESVLSQRIGKRVDGPAYPFIKGASKQPRRDLNIQVKPNPVHAQSSSSQYGSSSAWSNKKRPISTSMSQRHNQGTASFTQPACSQIPSNSLTVHPPPRPHGVANAQRVSVPEKKPKSNISQEYNPFDDQDENIDDWDNDGFPDDDEELLEVVEQSKKPDFTRPIADKRVPLKNLQSGGQLQEICAPGPRKNFSQSSTNSSFPGCSSTVLDKPRSIVRPLNMSVNENFPSSLQSGIHDNSERKATKHMALDNRDRSLHSKSFSKDVAMSTQSKRTIQTSISSFLGGVKKRELNKEHQIETAGHEIPGNNQNELPDFNLTGDFFEDVEMVEDNNKVIVSQEPFLYLSEVKQKLMLNPEMKLEANFKATSATLAGGIKVKKVEGKPTWHIALYINDGSDASQVQMSGEMLEEELGSAADYVSKSASDPHMKAQAKEKMKSLSAKLARLNGIVRLRFSGDPRNLPTVVSVDEPSGLHLAKLRKRRLKSF